MKILYLIHVCWEWIFQRPQILELLLQEDFSCTVVNKTFLPGKKVTRSNILPKRMIPAYQLPGAEKLPLIGPINDLLYKWQVKRELDRAAKAGEAYAAIWVCHPDLYPAIPEGYNGKLIYDCMDNHTAMASKEHRKKLHEAEQELIRRADSVFATSEKLMETVPCLKEKALLIRNGYRAGDPAPIKRPSVKQSYKIGYFGTISSWFDRELLLKSREWFPEIDYHLLGPSERGIDLTGFQYEGIVEHKELGKRVAEYDALIMPFVVNDIILSVDPVKLYEYICFGKCVISVWYPEIERFRPYVYFYRTEKEYEVLLRELTEKGFPPKYTQEQQRNFLKENSWEKRYESIRRELQNV